MEKGENLPSKISNGTWMVLIGLAILFDVLEALISLIPVLGEIISMGIDLLAFGTFWLIFKMNGEKYSKTTMLGGLIFGFIPILNMLPECTVAITKFYIDAQVRNALAKSTPQNNVVRMTPRFKEQNKTQDHDDMQKVA